MNLKIVLNIVIVCVVVGLVICGCKKQKIEFHRDSSVQKLLDSVNSATQPQKSYVKKSAGVIIYKDNSYQNNQINKRSIRFGPKDINFDMKVTF